MPEPLRRTDHVTFEYNVHLVFVTRRRFDFLDPHVSEAVLTYWRRVCTKYGSIAWDIEVIWNHAHLFLRLRPDDSAEDVTLSLMNNPAHFLHRRNSAVLRNKKLAGVWKPGDYAGTAGFATTVQIQSYLGCESETVGRR